MCHDNQYQDVGIDYLDVGIESSKGGEGGLSGLTGGVVRLFRLIKWWCLLIQSLTEGKWGFDYGRRRFICMVCGQSRMFDN